MPREVPTWEDGRLTWGFREGHLLTVRREQPLWIPAEKQPTPMRLLLSEVQHDNQRLSEEAMDSTRSRRTLVGEARSWSRLSDSLRRTIA